MPIRKNHSLTPEPGTVAAVAAVATPAPPTPDPVIVAIEEALVRARQGDDDAVQQLREILDGNPGIWQRYGDLAGVNQNAWLMLIAGDDLLVQESVQRRVEQFKAELAGPTPSPLEKLLVERIASAWLQTHHADLLMASSPADRQPAARDRGTGWRFG